MAAVFLRKRDHVPPASRSTAMSCTCARTPGRTSVRSCRFIIHEELFSLISFINLLPHFHLQLALDSHVPYRNMSSSAAGAAAAPASAGDQGGLFREPAAKVDVKVTSVEKQAGKRKKPPPLPEIPRSVRAPESSRFTSTSSYTFGWQRCLDCVCTHHATTRQSRHLPAVASCQLPASVVARSDRTVASSGQSRRVTSSDTSSLACQQLIVHERLCKMCKRARMHPPSIPTECTA